MPSHMQQTRSHAAYCKSPYESIKHSTYFAVYDRLFGGYAGKDITFVEVGVLNGGSLFMWREFFGPQARIVGIDLNPAAAQWREHGFEIHIGSQSDPAFWAGVAKALGPVDILLDDGGHTYEQQIVTVEAMLPAIKDGGLLVVEDTHTSYMKGFGNRKYSFINYAKRMIDRINQRFHGLASPRQQPETRAWSLRFFESFVVFEVNQPATATESAATSNGGASQGAVDYGRTANWPAWLRPFKRVIILKSIIKRLVNNRKTRTLKRYF